MRKHGGMQMQANYERHEDGNNIKGEGKKRHPKVAVIDGSSTLSRHLKDAAVAVYAPSASWSG